MSEYIYERPDEPAKVIRDGWNVRIEWDFKQREEIVRCRDCRHYHAEFSSCDEFGDKWHDEYATVEPNGYCAWGERRADA